MGIKEILKKQISIVKPSLEDSSRIREETEKFVKELGENIKKKKIRAEVFVGGSTAKGTVIRKKEYDVDIFVRFNEKYKEGEVSDLLASVVKGERIHGSRDYFQIRKKGLVFEIIPVIKVSKPEEARNITDLSYFHVSYILGKIKKNPKLGEEIMLAKAFCYSQRCYGAESYIRGFSGYALEILVSYYGSFANFIKAVAKSNQIVIDPEKFYKDKDEIMENLNEAKLQSPIIVVDPTFKQRNALAALSIETFERFQKVVKDFLKKPSGKFFETYRINEKKFDFILEAESDRQEGDIAGSKLLKFYNHLVREIGRCFVISGKDFDYDGKAKYYFKVRKMNEIILSGPPVNKLENLLAFKNAHRDVFIKNNKAYAREKVNVSFDKFIDNFKKDNKGKMKEMGITGLRII